MSDDHTVHRFNFGSTVQPAASPSPNNEEHVSIHSQPPCCEELTIKPNVADYAQGQLEEVQVRDTDLMLLKGRVNSDQAASLVGSSEVAASDLVPGTYEGGFKLWEGALDLTAYLAQQWHLGAHLLTAPGDPVADLADKRVLELGCGHALPGLLAALAGAEVVFQDYNREVLTQLTAPNLFANAARLPATRRPVRARFVAGGWGQVGEFLCLKGYAGNFDYILAAETIYNTASQEQFYECIKQCLRPPHGVAYIAAKTFYFGVGGGTTSFKKLLRQDGILEVQTVANFDDGCGNRREILKLSFPESIHPYFM